MKNFKKYPGVKALLLEVAYDNNMIDRYCTEVEWLQYVIDSIHRSGLELTHTELSIWSEWLLNYPEQMTIIATGEQSEALDALKLVPEWEQLDILIHIAFDS